MNANRSRMEMSNWTGTLNSDLTGGFLARLPAVLTAVLPAVLTAVLLSVQVFPGRAHAAISNQSFRIAASPSYDELDGVALAQALLLDGHIQAAKEVMELHYKIGDPLSHLGMAQLKYKLEDLEGALFELNLGLRRFDNSQQILREIYSLQLELAVLKGDGSLCVGSTNQLRNLLGMRISLSERIQELHCDRIANRTNLFFEHIREAQSEHPNEDLFFKLEIEELLKLRLIHVAELRSAANLKNEERSDSFRLNLLDLWQSTEWHAETTRLLELSHLTAVDPIEFQKRLARHTYERNLPLAALDLLVRASAQDASLISLAGEIARSEGRFQQAQYLTSRMDMSEEKQRAQIAMASEKQIWSLLATLVSKDSPLIGANQKDPDLKYSLAYSLARLSFLNEGLKELSDLDKTQGKSVQLKEAILKCSNFSKLCSF